PSRQSPIPNSPARTGLRSSTRTAATSTARMERNTESACLIADHGVRSRSTITGGSVLPFRPPLPLQTLPRLLRVHIGWRRVGTTINKNERIPTLPDDLSPPTI